MESEIKDLREDLKKIMIDVALIKNAFLDEGELTDWAKKELKRAREESEENYIDLDDLRKEIENDLQD